MKENWLDEVLSEEDRKILFEQLLMGYFSKQAPTPHQIIYDVIEHADNYGIDSYERSMKSVAVLEIIDQIGLTAQQYFPHLRKHSFDDFLKGADIADDLHITDAFMHGKDCIVLVLPLTHFHHLTTK